MRLGGWYRLGIAIAVLYGVLVAGAAYSARPHLEQLHRAWFADASEVVARYASDGASETTSPYEILRALTEKGTEEAILTLEDIAAAQHQGLSADVAHINEKHKAILENYPAHQRKYWLAALAWWAGGVLLLFGVGSVVRWIYQGFRSAVV